MPKMTPYSSLLPPSPGAAPAGVTTLQASATNGLRFSARNVDGSTANYWLLRQASDSGIWLKTAYGATLAGAGAEAEVHLGPEKVIDGELWAVMTDRAPGSNDLVYLSNIGASVDLSTLSY